MGPGCPSRVAADEQKKETIGYLTTGGGLCSGTLLSPHVVITAAHCVEFKRPEDVRFSLSPELHDKGGASSAPVTRIRIHPGFAKKRGREYGGADLALLQLGNTGYGKEPLVFYSVEDGDAELQAGATAYVIGYGLNKESPGGLRRSRHIRFGARALANLADGKRVPSGVFVFIRGDEGEMPCGGDSGSPILKFVKGKTSIIAIHSASSATAQGFRHGFQGRTSHRQICRISSETFDTAIGPFKPWIESTWAELETDRPAFKCPGL